MVEAYAFLDSGSNTSFCTQDLLTRLNVKGKRTTLSLTTIEKANSKTESSIVSLELSDLNGENTVAIETVFSTPNLPISTKNLATREDIDKWTYLSVIKSDRIDEEIGLVIGCDVPEVLEPIEIRKSERGGPYAAKTVFGYVVNGPLGRNAASERTTNFVEATDIRLESMFKDFCNMEFTDTQDSNEIMLSKEDQRALDMMNGSVKLTAGHYEVGLPWKKTSPKLPNN